MSLSRERVYKTIKQEPVEDVVKGELIIEDNVIAKTLNKQSIGFEERYEFIKWLELDIVTIAPLKKGNEIPQVSELVFPDLEKWAATSLFIFAILDGPFEVGLRFLGLNKFFSLLKKSPQEVLELVEKVENTNRRKIKELAQRGINGVVLADDIAFKQGLYVNPKFLREYFFPSYTRLVEEIKKQNLVAFFHSDGNYRQVLADIIKAGFDGVHCLDRDSGMDIKETREEVGKALCLWGHLTVEDLKMAKHPESREEVRSFAKKLSARGGFILGTTTGIYDGLDLEGLALLYRREKD
ncbi:MAG: uroporphyrinogen decarboxylase [Eubacteriales bacterium]|nr:uroporphyrinogen decarboxylase [Eubacteriales bacterium]